MAIRVKLILRDIDECKHVKPIIHMSRYISQDNHKDKLNRRLYRDKLIAKALDSEEFVVNQDNHTIASLYNFVFYSASYSECNILLGMHDVPIGVDLERYTKLSVEKGCLFMNQSERKIINEHFSGRNEIESICMAWCFKESIGKLFNVGISKGINAFTFVECQDSAHYILYMYYKFMEKSCWAVCLESSLE